VKKEPYTLCKYKQKTIARMSELMAKLVGGGFTHYGELKQRP